MKRIKREEALARIRELQEEVDRVFGVIDLLLYRLIDLIVKERGK